jgi:hypothetical protein
MDVLLRDLVPHLEKKPGEKDQDFNDRVRQSFKEWGGYNAHNILRFWRKNGMKNAFKVWGLEGLGLALDKSYSTTQNAILSEPSFLGKLMGQSLPAFFQMRLRIETLSGNPTDKNNPLNYIAIRYESGENPPGTPVSQLSVQSPLFAQNQEVTVKCFETMQKLMDKTGNKALMFDLDEYLKNPESLKLMRTIFADPANQGLLDRVSFEDRQKLGLGPAPKATFLRPGMMAHANPPAEVRIAAPPFCADSVYERREVVVPPSGAINKRDPYLQSEEVQAIAQTALADNGFTEMRSGDPLGLYERDSDASSTPTIYVIAKPVANIHGTEDFWGVLRSQASSFREKPCKILGIMAVGDPANHYVSVSVEVDATNRVSVKVADSLNGMYLDGKASVSAGAPFNDFNAIKTGAKDFATTIGCSFEDSVTHEGLLADRAVVHKQPDHISCGLYAVRNLFGLAGIAAPTGPLGDLRSDTTQPIRSKDKDGNANIQQNARDVLSKFTEDLNGGVTGPQLARLWWEGSHCHNPDTRVSAVKAADDAARAAAAGPASPPASP